MSQDATISLIVCGFIREIQQMLDNENNKTIIPFPVIQLCDNYYFVSISKMIYKSTSGNFQFLSLDICNTKIMTNNMIEIIPNTNLKQTIVSPPFCFIPNILKINNKSYDGILVNICYNNELGIILFNKQETSKSHIFKSCIKSFEYLPDCYIFCGDKHGVIASISDDKLYQLTLENITNRNNYKFNLIYNQQNVLQTVRNIDCFMFKGIDMFTLNKLKMNYLCLNESIFAINCEYNQILPWNDVTQKYESCKCGIFDLNTKQWKLLKNMEYKSNKKHKSICALCNDYNENNIYCVTSMGFTTKYNFHKNKWIPLIHDINDTNMIFDDFDIINTNPPIINVWFDNYDTNMLCLCVVGQHRISKFRYFDIRNNKQKWNIIQSISPYKNGTWHHIF